MVVTKKCTKCFEVKLLEDFKKQKQHKDGFCSWCKSCHSIATINSTNRDNANRNNRKYKKTEKGRVATRKYKAQRRARIRDNFVQLTAEEHSAIREIYKKCRAMRLAGSNMEVDHIMPIAKGGLHIPQNLRIITAEQNKAKGCSVEDLGHLELRL